MRSRYCAFVRHDWEYLNVTQKVRDNAPPTADIEWLGLEVLGTQGGGADDLEGSVEFIAHYRHQAKAGTLHEISLFRKQDGNWVYIDGEFPSTPRQPKTGRNDPCPCGSGKKFKKCCSNSINQGIGTTEALP